MEEDEFYTVDINPSATLIAFGGKSDTLYVSEYPSLRNIHTLDDFEDSLMYTKFIDNETIFAASLEGIICLYCIVENEIIETARLDLEEDISKIEYSGERFFIGTEKGSIHIFDSSLNDEILLAGHNTEIKELIRRNNKLYSLSSNKFIIFDLDSENMIQKRIVLDGQSMAVSGDEKLIFISGEYESYILKDEYIFKKYDFSSEAIFYNGNCFIAGGSGYNLNFINLKNNCVNERYKFMTENIEGFNSIIELGNNKIAVGTFCGKVGVGDLRDPYSIVFVDGGVGMIFDMKSHYKNIIVVGSFGINVLTVD
ncbi:hypothetical protein GVAV_002078 [Gurleya vavrai]